MTRQGKSYLYATIAIFLWSTVATAFKFALQKVSYIQLLFFASLTSTIALFIVILFQGKFNLLKKENKYSILKSALLGIINPFLYYQILFKAYSILPAQEAQSLNYTWSIWLMISSVPLLKEKFSWKNLVAILISFTGAIIVATKGNLWHFEFTNPLGDLLAFSSAIIWALFWIYSVKDNRNYVIKLFCSFVWGTFYIVIYSLIRRFNIFFINDIKVLFWLVYIGLFEMGITFLFWIKALDLSQTNAEISTYIYITPFLSLIFINFILKEKVLFSSIIGLFFIVGGIILQKIDIKLMLKKM